MRRAIHGLGAPGRSLIAPAARRRDRLPPHLRRLTQRHYKRQSDRPRAQAIDNPDADGTRYKMFDDAEMKKSQELTRIYCDRYKLTKWKFSDLHRVVDKF